MPVTYIQNNIELINTEVKEILGAPPKWIVRWGNILLLLFIGLLIVVGSLVKQYETVKGKVIIYHVQNSLRTIKTYRVFMQFSPAQFSSIKPGQQVMINVNNFPYQQFGSLKGLVITKPIIRNDTKATVLIQLKNNDTTTYNRKIDLSITTYATGEIIVGEKKLIKALLGF